MEEQQNNIIEESNQELKFSQRLMQWQCLLTDVFLVSAALTCLFRWLAYGMYWNMGGLILSLVTAAIVHLFALNTKRVPSMTQRSTIAFFALTGWIILLPVLMKLLGFTG